MRLEIGSLIDINRHLEGSLQNNGVFNFWLHSLFTNVLTFQC